VLVYHHHHPRLLHQAHLASNPSFGPVLGLGWVGRLFWNQRNGSRGEKGWRGGVKKKKYYVLPDTAASTRSTSPPPWPARDKAARENSIGRWVQEAHPGAIWMEHGNRRVNVQRLPLNMKRFINYAIFFNFFWRGVAANLAKSHSPASL